MNPGFYPSTELSNAEYHNGPGVSNSGLKLLGEKTPAHFFARYLHPNRPGYLSTQAQLIGTAFHGACLEPDQFDETYVIAPYETKQQAGYKAWASDQSRIILMHKELTNVRGMRQALFAHPKAAFLLQDDPVYEESAYATDQETGRLLRIRMDCLTSSGWITDLKKTQDASPAAVARTVAKYGYHHQAAMYLDVFKQAAGEASRGFAFIFVEEEFPHVTGVYLLSAEDLARGHQLYRRNLHIYDRCMRDDTWPGYSDQAEKLELSVYDRRRIDELLTQEQDQ